MAGRDRPNDIPSYNGTGWFRQAALAVNWLLQRDVAPSAFDMGDSSSPLGSYDLGDSSTPGAGIGFGGA